MRLVALLMLSVAACGWLDLARVLAEEDGPPRLLLTTGGPSESVRALRFSPSGDHFYSAGGDKYVSVWAVSREGPGQFSQARLSQKIYWEIARSHRGVVYALAVSPDERLIAFAGQCARNSNGNIWIYDVTRDALVKVLGGEIIEGHRNTVIGLDFSPDGKRLLSVSKDGMVCLWNVADWKQHVVVAAGRQEFQWRAAIFLSSSRFVIGAADEQRQGNSRLVLYDVERPTAPLGHARRSHVGQVVAIARDPASGRWASSDQGGNVYLWDGSAEVGSWTLADNRLAQQMAFDGDRLFVTTQRQARRPAVAQLWDTRTKRLLDELTLAAAADGHACTVSPKGDYFITYAGDTAELLFIELRDADGKRHDQPLTRGRTSRLRGTGQKIWKVAFDAADSYKIGLAEKLREDGTFSFGDAGEITRYFDLARPSFLPPRDAPGRLRSYTDGAGGWKVTPSSDRYTLTLSFQGQARGTIRLDNDYQGPLTAYCWLADAQGQPYGIAVGTAQQHGVFVYALPRQGACRLLRYFRDHSGWVTSVGASSDGKYLASSSADGTIKVWSLEGLLAEERPWKGRAAWGMSLDQGDNNQRGLVVRNLLDVGIAARRGLQEGDVITAVTTAQGTTTTPDRMLDALQGQLWQGYMLSYQKQGRGPIHRTIPLVPGWEPLCSLLVDRRGEWAMWTPQGYFDASVNGGELFGWLINRGWDKKPEFYQAAQFRKDLERPQLMRELLAAGDLPRTMQKLGLPTPSDVQQRQFAAAEVIPEVTILSPRQHETFAVGEEFEVIARVDFPDARVERYVPRCFVSGVAYTQPSAAYEGHVGLFRWKVRAGDRVNRVQVRVDEETPGHDTRFARASVYVRTKREKAPPRPYRLHLVALTSSKYTGLPALTGNEDGDRLLAAVGDRAGPYYELGTTKVFRDDQVSEEAVAAYVRQLNEEHLSSASSERDLLMVFVAGHGFEYQNEYYYVPAGARAAAGIRLEVIHRDLAEARKFAGRVKELGVSWRTLRQFGEVRCRKVFALDTCRESLDQLMGEAVSKASIRPLQDMDSQVIAATRSGKLSFEGRGDAGGYFTQSLVAALAGEADGFAVDRANPPDPDGTTDLEELTGFVGHRIKELMMADARRPDEVALRDYIRHEGYQTPYISDTGLPFIPLSK